MRLCHLVKILYKSIGKHFVTKSFLFGGRINKLSVPTPFVLLLVARSSRLGNLIGSRVIRICAYCNFGCLLTIAVQYLVTLI